MIIITAVQIPLREGWAEDCLQNHRLEKGEGSNIGNIEVSFLEFMIMYVWVMNVMIKVPTSCMILLSSF